MKSIISILLLASTSAINLHTRPMTGTANESLEEDDREHGLVAAHAGPMHIGKGYISEGVHELSTHGTE